MMRPVVSPWVLITGAAVDVVDAVAAVVTVGAEASVVAVVEPVGAVSESDFSFTA